MISLQQKEPENMSEYRKTEEELRYMQPEQLASRLRDVSETLAKIRKMKRSGLGNPRVYQGLKKEKKLILRIQKEGLNGKKENVS